MNIFLDTVSPKNALILFNDDKKILSKYFFDVRLNESTLLIEEFDNFLKNNNLKYSDLENIVLVNWPWSFTWIRTTVLLVNTINFVINKHITTINYFELFEKYPIIKSSSKRDSFVKYTLDSEVLVLQNDVLEQELFKKSIFEVSWDINFLKEIKVNSEVNYDKIIKNIQFKNIKIATPAYFKKPSIT